MTHDVIRFEADYWACLNSSDPCLASRRRVEFIASDGLASDISDLS